MNLENPICPSCGANREDLETALNSKLEWVEYPDGIGRFLGKPEAKVRAELLIAKCDSCREYFKEKKWHLQ